MAFGGPSQYDLLLQQAWEKYIEASATDANLEGEYNAMDVLVWGEFLEDEEYKKHLAELKEEFEPGSRTFMQKHMALIMWRLRRRGHLDQAPLPKDKGSREFLSE